MRTCNTINVDYDKISKMMKEKGINNTKFCEMVGYGHTWFKNAKNQNSKQSKAICNMICMILECELDAILPDKKEPVIETTEEKPDAAPSITVDMMKSLEVYLDGKFNALNERIDGIEKKLEKIEKDFDFEHLENKMNSVNTRSFKQFDTLTEILDEVRHWDDAISGIGKIEKRMNAVETVIAELKTLIPQPADLLPKPSIANAEDFLKIAIGNAGGRLLEADVYRQARDYGVKESELLNARAKLGYKIEIITEKGNRKYRYWSKK